METTKLKIPTLFLSFTLLFSPITSFAADITPNNSSTATMGVEGGELYLSEYPTSITMSSVTLDGVTWIVSTGTLSPVTVTDARGTGDGWKLLVSATQVREIGGLDLTLPVGSVVFYSARSASALSGTESPNPTIIEGYGLIDSTPYTVASAAKNTGLGSYKIDFHAHNLQIEIPPRERLIDKINYPTSATPYQTTLTWTLSSTP